MSNSSKRKSHTKWLRLSQYDEDTILYWAVHAPSVIMEALVTEVIWPDNPNIRDQARQQANDILDTVRSIRPPKRPADRWEFVIRLGRGGDFDQFRLVKKGSGVLGTGEYLSDTLNLAPREWYTNEGERRLISQFHREFFGGNPSPKAIRAFIGRPQNFGDYFL